MGTVQIDQIKDLSMRERDSAIVELRRLAVVSGLANTNTDHRTLQEALDEAGIPASGSTPAGTEYAQLILVERNPTMMSTNIANVELVYQDRKDAGVGFVFEGGSSLTSVQSVNDRFGSQITVSHQGVVQGGVISVLQPQFTLRATGILARDYPWLEAADWEGFINSSRWASGGPAVWMCTAVTFVPVNLTASPSEWRFTFEFQANVLGHQPEVVFTDAATGKPPPKLVRDVGFKIVRWYPRRDFNDLFPIVA